MPYDWRWYGVRDPFVEQTEEFTFRLYAKLVELLEKHLYSEEVVVCCSLSARLKEWADDYCASKEIAIDNLLRRALLEFLASGPIPPPERKETTMTEKTVEFPPPAPKKLTLEEHLTNVFGYHQPIGNQGERYDTLRDVGVHVGLLLCQICPQSRELSLAQTKLEECLMWAKKAIMVNENPVPVVDEPAPPAAGE